MQSLFDEIRRTGGYGILALGLGSVLTGLWLVCFGARPAGTTRLGRLRDLFWTCLYWPLTAGAMLMRGEKTGVLDWPVLAGLTVGGLLFPFVFVPIAQGLSTVLGPVVRALGRALTPVIQAMPRTTPFRFAMGVVLFLCAGLAALLVRDFMQG
jgi:hypothetical protein